MLVTKVHKDKDGFMWFGTDIGVARYDGYRYKHFKSNHANPSLSLSNNFTNGILSDSKGNIWVATEYGLNKISKGIVSEQYLPSENERSLPSTWVLKVFEIAIKSNHDKYKSLFCKCS